jgi:hypothetical protein
MINMEHFFCEDLGSALISHIRICEHCRRGARELLVGFPMLSMIMPGKSKDALLAALDQIEREQPHGT